MITIENITSTSGRPHSPCRPCIKPSVLTRCLCLPTPYQTAWKGDGWTFDDAQESADVASLRRMERTRLGRRSAAEAERGRSTPTVITQIPRQLDASILSNALILVDKPRDWSDQEVEQALRWSFKMKAVSSPGKLDLLASGLMVLCLGRATRLANLFHEQPSSYTGVVRLGEATDTFDASGQITDSQGWDHIKDADVQAVVGRFQGEIMQVPPSKGCFKMGGRRLIKSLLDDPDGELRPEPVYVSSFDAHLRSDSSGNPDIDISITLSQSGFVRSIAHDLGRALGSCSHLFSLRRESIGPFSVEDAWTMDVLLPLLKKYRK